MQCAGNRRAEMGAVAPVAGVPWTPGAIGNASWTGVSLAAVLRACGAEHHPSLHVAFACADTCELEGKRFNYGASIPIEKAMTQAVLLAWAMNGETLTPENGYPLRVVVPGYAGVRSPKWLNAFTVQDAPSDSPIQADDTSCSPPDWTKQTADPARGLTINDMPVNSAICTPRPTQCCRPDLRPSVDTRSRRCVRSFGWTCRPMTAGAGVRPSCKRIPRPRGPGRCGTRKSIYRKATTSWRCGRMTKPGKRSRIGPLKSGTTKAISAPLGTACRSPLPDATGPRRNLPHEFSFSCIPEEIDDGNEIPVPLVRRGNRA